MSDLASKLRKLAKFDVYKVLPFYTVKDPMRILAAARNEHARLQPLLDALIECAEALPGCLCDARWSGIDELEYSACGCPNCSCKHLAALARLQALVDGGGK